jgi:hypothetical protein
MPAMARRPKTPHPPIVFVEWHDSAVLSSGWKNREEILNDGATDWPELLVAAGFLLEQTKRYIVLAVAMNTVPDDACCVMQIPRSDIVSMRTVLPDRGVKVTKAHRIR